MSFRTDTLKITPEMLALIAEIDEFKGAWRALGMLAPERLSALRRVATIASIGSSTRIEGGKLSDQQVGRLLSHLEIKKLETRDGRGFMVWLTPDFKTTPPHMGNRDDGRSFEPTS